VTRPSLVAGPIGISAQLREVLQIVDALGLFTASGRPLRTAYITELEQRRGMTFPHDILALIAHEVPVLVTLTGLSRSGLERLDVCDDSGIAAGWVPVGWFDASGGSPSGDLHTPVALCVNKRHHQRSREGDPQVCAYDERYHDTRGVKLSVFLRDQLARHHGRGVDAAARWKAASTSPSPKEPPRALLVDDPPLAPVTVQRVTHATFGPGAIVRIIDDKAEVAFDSGATRTLRRSFLRES
jgi:hypothetical protein